LSECYSSAERRYAVPLFGDDLDGNLVVVDLLDEGCGHRSSADRP